jgi:serine/threonine-protein kinase
VGEFKVRRLIGEGPHGAVHAGVHPTLGQTVAIKIVHSRRVAGGEATAFVDAARRAAGLAHPGIVRTLAAGVLDNGLPYAIAELAAGQTLAAMLAELGPLATPDAAPLLDALAAALDAAHAHGLVHGDLKPENVFLAARPDGRWPPTVQVGDFATAVLLRPRSASASEDEDDPRAASPHYLSPEQCRGAPGDARSDVYALGAVAHHMLTGQAPYAPAQGAEVLRMHREGAPRSGDGALDTALRAVIAQAMALDPVQRFPTMGALRDAWAAAVAAAPPSPAATAAPAPKVDVDASLFVEGRAAAPERAAPLAPARSTAKLPRMAPRRTGAALRWALLWVALVGGGTLAAYRLAAGAWPWAPTAHHPTPGMLDIATTPPGAMVFIDRTPWHRRTPASIPLARGRHYALHVHKPGFLPWHQQVSLGVQEPARLLRIKLVQATRWGTLLLTTNRKADIFLDGRRVGTQTTEVTLAEVRAGIEHEVRIVAPGFHTVTQQIRVEPDKVGVFSFPLARVDTPRDAG